MLRLAFILSAATTLAGVHSTKLAEETEAARPDTQQELDALWSEFKRHFDKHYASEQEEDMRKRYFDENMRRAEVMNEKDNNWIPYSHLSPLADWSKTEFQRRNSLQAETIRAQLGAVGDEVVVTPPFSLHGSPRPRRDHMILF